MVKHKLLYIYIFVALAVILCTNLIACKKSNISNTYEEQKNEVYSFFEQNHNTLNTIKDTVYEEKNKIVNISEDGYFITNDSQKIWMDSISNDIKNLYDKYQNEDVIFNICPHSSSSDLIISIEFYFHNTGIMYTISYSETDLTATDRRYYRLDTDWYYKAMGMV